MNHRISVQRLPIKTNLQQHVIFAQDRLIPSRNYATSHYQTLGVQPGASKKEIKAAFVKLSKQFHPDVNKEPGANEKFLEIKEAADTLLNKSSGSPASSAQGHRSGSAHGHRHGRHGYEDIYHQRRVWEEARRRENRRRETEDVRRQTAKHQEFWKHYYNNKQRISDEEFWRQYYKQRDEWYGDTRRHFNADERREQWSKYYERSQQRRQEHFEERNERIRQTMKDHQNRRKDASGQENFTRSDRSRRSEAYYSDPFGYDENPFKTIKEEYEKHVQMDDQIGKSYLKKFFLGFIGLMIFIMMPIIHVGGNSTSDDGRRPGVFRLTSDSDETQDDARDKSDKWDFKHYSILGTYGVPTSETQTKHAEDSSKRNS